MRVQVQVPIFKQHMWERYRVPAFFAGWLANWRWLVRQWHDNKRNDAAFQRTAPLQFYDTWVARDHQGALFSKLKPYVSSAYSSARLRSGFPFPVKCCWNGLAVLDAAPFYRGLRFRCRAVAHWLHRAF
jgi:Cryptococcal mannosyltransferase 1